MTLPPCCTRYFIQQKHVFFAFWRVFYGRKVCYLSPAGVNREWRMLKWLLLSPASLFTPAGLKWQTLRPQNTRQEAQKTCLCCLKYILWYYIVLSKYIIFSKMHAENKRCIFPSIFLPKQYLVMILLVKWITPIVQTL